MQGGTVRCDIEIRITLRIERGHIYADAEQIAEPGNVAHSGELGQQRSALRDKVVHKGRFGGGEGRNGFAVIPGTRCNQAVDSMKVERRSPLFEKASASPRPRCAAMTVTDLPSRVFLSAGSAPRSSSNSMMRM